MKGSIKYILTNATIILMTVLLCLPCSVKREVKQALNIPVTSLEHSEKANKTIACQTFARAEKHKISESCQKKDIQNYNDKDRLSFCQDDALRSAVFAIAGDGFPLPVPIYILHEQYLI